MTVRNPSYDYGTQDFPLQYVTIGEMLEATAQKFPDNEAIVSIHENKRLTYREFDRIVSDLAKGLLKIGIKRGDRVGVWGLNRWEWTAAQFATAKIGAVQVNINPAYRTHELKYALNQSETQSIILMHSFKQSKYKDMLLEVCPELADAKPGELNAAELPHLKNVILMDGEGIDTPTGMFSLSGLINLGNEVPDEELKSI
ncbi:AMP-binding protein, partial [Myxococcota bacterium]|nr:AMP-binding protein [Myxococcota bacterium]